MLVRRRKRRIAMEQATIRVEQAKGFPAVAPSTEDSPTVVVTPAENPALSGPVDARKSKDLDSSKVLWTS
jgi:hypothetical protein